MTDLQQAIRDSAEALGRVIDEGRTKSDWERTGVLWINLPCQNVSIAKNGRMTLVDGVCGTIWNPPENEKQDRLLLHWLLEEGWFVYSYGPHEHMVEHSQNTQLPEFRFDCPPNEFLTRATAAVWAVKESEK